MLKRTLFTDLNLIRFNAKAALKPLVPGVRFISDKYQAKKVLDQINDNAKTRAFEAALSVANEAIGLAQSFADLPAEVGLFKKKLGLTTNDLDYFLPFIQDVLRVRAKYQSLGLPATAEELLGRGFHIGYFPHLKKVMYLLPKPVDTLIKTSRNLGLVPLEVQAKLYKQSFLIIGTSVNASAVEMLVRSGIGHKFTLFDSDTFELSNVFRCLNADRWEVNMPKAYSLAARMLNLDPWLKVRVKKRRFQEDDFRLLSSDNYTFVLEGIDNTEMKLKLRRYLKATRAATPILLMATDNGFDVPDLSVENHNQKNMAIFCDKNFSGYDKAVDRKALIKQVVQIIGIDKVSSVWIPALYLFAHGLFPYWPQHPIAAGVNGGMLAFLLQERIKKKDLGGGRTISALQNILGPSYFKQDDSTKKMREIFFQSLG